MMRECLCCPALVKEHQPLIAKAFSEHPEWNLHDAYLHVLHTEILPKADQVSQAKLLDSLKTQAAGSTVHPGASTPGGIPKFKSHKEALIWFDAHPVEADAWAQR